MMNVTARVKELELTILDYSEQLDGFSEGFNTQVNIICFSIHVIFTLSRY